MPRISGARFLLILSFAIVGGCTDGKLVDERASAPPPAAPPAQERKAGSQLAYEHSVSIEGEAAFVRERFISTRDACLKDDKFGCTLIRASMTSGAVPSARLQMRLAPSGVPRMLEIASAGGEVAEHHTSAEDLTAPVEDTDRQLQMLTRHRTRLEELQARRDLGVDQLIRLSQELAQVQTSIENLTASRSQLQRRLDTELLSIQLNVPVREWQAQQTPIRDALRSFGSSLADGTGSAIETIAFGLPWLLFVIIPLVLLVRFAWRSRRKGTA